VHIQVEDSTSGEDTDGEGGGGIVGATGGEGDGEVEKEEAAEAEEEGAEQRDLRAHQSGASPEGGSEAVRQHSLPLGALSEPGSPQVRLRAPERLADNAVPDNDVQVKQEEVGGGFVPNLAKRGGPGHAGSYRFKGVCWN
jgi:hypothetical protein